MNLFMVIKELFTVNEHTLRKPFVQSGLQQNSHKYKYSSVQPFYG